MVGRVAPRAPSRPIFKESQLFQAVRRRARSDAPYHGIYEMSSTRLGSIPDDTAAGLVKPDYLCPSAPVSCVIIKTPFQLAGSETRTGRERNRSLALRCLRFHPAHGVMEQARGVLELQLFLNVSAVNVHRLGTQMQRLGNLLGALAAAEQAEHFELPVAEFLDG